MMMASSSCFARWRRLRLPALRQKRMARARRQLVSSAEELLAKVSDRSLAGGFKLLHADRGVHQGF